MENTPLRPKRVIRVSKKAAIIFVILVFFGIYLLTILGNTFQVGNSGKNLSFPTESTRGVSAPSMPTAIYPDQYGYGTPSVNDTREFLKVAYGADIKTRDVRDVMRDVKSAIDTADGRIDNSNESDKYAYISFVVPKSNLSDFRDEIESITNEKLITENTSSQNLLGQKQSIEEQRASATSSLANLQKQDKDLTAKHTQTVNSLQKQITSTQKQLASVRTEISNTSDQNKLTTLRNQEYTLTQQLTSEQQSLNSENSTYAANSQNIKNQISYVNAQLESINKQDIAFGNNIETVSGYISVNWISLWEMAKIFSPVHPTIVIIVLVLLVCYYLKRKNYLPGIEFV